MKLKIVVCSLGLLSFFAGMGYAQDDSKLDLFVGYSYVRANPFNSQIFPPPNTSIPSFHMHGGEASLAYRFNSWLSGVFDFGGYRTSRVVSNPPDSKGNMYTYLFGPRFSYRHTGRVTPFAQTLFGIAHATSPTYLIGHNQTNFAMTVGGGFDYRLSRRFSLRPVQADYMLTRFKEVVETGDPPTQNNVRLSTGLVLHF